MKQGQILKVISIILSMPQDIYDQTITEEQMQM